MCCYCGDAFKCRKSLILHEKQHRGDIPAYECPICNKRLTQNGGLHRHMRMHADVREHECNVCHKKLRSKYSLAFL